MATAIAASPRHGVMTWTSIQTAAKIASLSRV